jgi:hypothetical protein
LLRSAQTLSTKKDPVEVKVESTGTELHPSGELTAPQRLTGQVLRQNVEWVWWYPQRTYSALYHDFGPTVAASVGFFVFCTGVRPLVGRVIPNIGLGLSLGVQR